MLKHSTIKHIALLSILLIALVMISGTYEYTECSLKHDSKSPVITASKSVHPEVTFLTREDQRTSFQFLSPALFNSLAARIDCVDFSEGKLSFFATLNNYPVKLNHAFTHYFNGSKYR